VLQLRELDLQLAFMGACALGENIENQTSTIQHPTLQGFLEIALLTWAQGMVEQHDVDLLGDDLLTKNFNLAFTDKETRRGRGTLATDIPDRLSAGRDHQFFEFVRIFVLAFARKIHVNQQRTLTGLRTIKEQGGS